MSEFGWDLPPGMTNEKINERSSEGVRLYQVWAKMDMNWASVAETNDIDEAFDIAEKEFLSEQWDEIQIEGDGTVLYNTEDIEMKHLERKK